MTYGLGPLIVISIALFFTGLWVESYDKQPKMIRGMIIGLGFVLIGLVKFWVFE